MKKVLVCVLFIITVIVGSVGGGLIGFQAASNRYLYAEPPEGPYSWYYLGTVIESTAKDGADEFTITVKLSDNFDNAVRIFRITPKTAVAGEISPELLQPGDCVELFIKTYHHLPEVLCELFCAKFVND